MQYFPIFISANTKKYKKNIGNNTENFLPNVLCFIPQSNISFCVKWSMASTTPTNAQNKWQNTIQFDLIQLHSSVPLSPDGDKAVLPPVSKSMWQYFFKYRNLKLVREACLGVNQDLAGGARPPLTDWSHSPDRGQIVMWCPVQWNTD